MPLQTTDGEGQSNAAKLGNGDFYPKINCIFDTTHTRKKKEKKPLNNLGGKDLPAIRISGLHSTMQEGNSNLTGNDTIKPYRTPSKNSFGGQ